MKNIAHTATAQDFIRIAEALLFAKDAHDGQKYGDVPYIEHPIQVANTIDNASADEFIAGLLHDVVEDTQYGVKDIEERFGIEVVEMVVLLTKDDTMDYRANIQRIIDSGNRGAMKVKLADNRVNLSGDKSKMDPARATKLVTRYTMSIEMLSKALNK